MQVDFQEEIGESSGSFYNFPNVLTPTKLPNISRMNTNSEKVKEKLNH